MKNLLVLTTAGRLHFLRDAIATLRDPLDVLVVDDATPTEVGIEKFCNKHNLHFITKSRPRGLTDSWNRAYRFFRDNHYDVCILSNDDVRFPIGFSHGLLKGTRKFSILCPISNMPTQNPKMFREQWLHRYTSIKATARRSNRDVIQKMLEKRFAKKPYKRINSVNGFCFAFGRGVSKFGVSDDVLFNGHLNTKNEILLCRRVHSRGGITVLSMRSYVFHWKRGTYNELNLKHSNQLWTASKTPIGK